MNEMVEKLKKNLAQWQYLSNDEHEFLKFLPVPTVQFLENKGIWSVLLSRCSGQYGSIYRICPDYVPKPPEPEIIECEVYEESGILQFKYEDDVHLLHSAVDFPECIGIKSLSGSLYSYVSVGAAGWKVLFRRTK